jgi:carboxymethylenebutenolidase
MTLITLAEDGGRRFEAWRAGPETPRAASLVHLVLLPNLFWRAAFDGVLSYESGPGQAWARLETFDFAAAVEDVRLALAAARGGRAGAKVAVLGFCFSGRLAFLAAARTDVDAAISLYALGIARDGAEAARVACPVQLHYGLEDEHVPRAEIDAVARAVAGRRNIELHLYPRAGHSFFNPVRPTFDPAAAALARGRIDALLARL